MEIVWLFSKKGPINSWSAVLFNRWASPNIYHNILTLSKGIASPIGELSFDTPTGCTKFAFMFPIQLH